MKLFAATFAFGLAFAASAHAFTPERAELLVDALRANNCAMTAAQAPEALGPLNLNPVEVQSFVDILHGAGLVTLSADMETLSLANSLCAATPEESLRMVTQAFADQEAQLQPYVPNFAPELGAAFVGALREHDCSLTNQQAAEVMPQLGIDPAVSRDVVTVMVEGGLATLSDDGSVLTLSDAMCQGDPAADGAILAQTLALWAEAAPADATGANTNAANNAATPTPDNAGSAEQGGAGQ